MARDSRDRDRKKCSCSRSKSRRSRSREKLRRSRSKDRKRNTSRERKSSSPATERKRRGSCERRDKRKRSPERERSKRKSRSRSASLVKVAKKESKSPTPEREKPSSSATETRVKKSFQEADRCLAMSLLAADYEETGQLIECACCFTNCVFENMAQCMEGHLVCVECLNSFAKEAVFGAGKASLGCMASECTSIYSEGELKRCLSRKTWKKLEERTLKENLNKANFKDLVTCPYCDFAAILSPRAKVFRCFRDKCQMKTCRDCGVDWADHEGLSCAAVETKDETSLRKEYEEKMTEAKVRTCIDCKAVFTKESGCNKMTCRCGTTMCYICRAARITYDHFCKHVREPGKGCSKCKACSLWTNPEVDDKRALKEIGREAKAKQVELGFHNVKPIGMPSARHN